jgi:hypothetical protein
VARHRALIDCCGLEIFVAGRRVRSLTSAGCSHSAGARPCLKMKSVPAPRHARKRREFYAVADIHPCRPNIFGNPRFPGDRCIIQRKISLLLPAVPLVFVINKIVRRRGLHCRKTLPVGTRPYRR